MVIATVSASLATTYLVAKEVGQHVAEVGAVGGSPYLLGFVCRWERARWTGQAECKRQTRVAVRAFGRQCRTTHGGRAAAFAKSRTTACATAFGRRDRRRLDRSNGGHRPSLFRSGLVYRLCIRGRLAACTGRGEPYRRPSASRLRRSDTRIAIRQAFLPPGDVRAVAHTLINSRTATTAAPLR